MFRILQHVLHEGMKKGQTMYPGTPHSILLQALGKSVDDVIRDCVKQSPTKQSVREVLDVCKDVCSLFADTQAKGFTFSDAGIHNLGVFNGFLNQPSTLFLDFEHSVSGTQAAKVTNVQLKRLFAAVTAHMSTNADWSMIAQTFYKSAWDDWCFPLNLLGFSGCFSSVGK